MKKGFKQKRKCLKQFTESRLHQRLIVLRELSKQEEFQLLVHNKKPNKHVPDITEKLRLTLMASTNSMLIPQRTDIPDKVSIISQTPKEKKILIRTPNKAFTCKIQVDPMNYFPWRVNWSKNIWNNTVKDIKKRFGSKIPTTFLINVGNTNQDIKSLIPECLTGTVVITGRFCESSQLHSRFNECGYTLKQSILGINEDKRFLTIASEDDDNPFQDITFLQSDNWKKFIFSTLNSTLNFDVVLDGGNDRKVENTIQVGKRIQPHAELIREISL